jgi:hypothetical protein
MKTIESILEKHGVVADVDYEVIAQEIKDLLISKRNIIIKSNEQIKIDFYNKTGLNAETYSNDYYISKVLVTHYDMILSVL